MGCLEQAIRELSMGIGLKDIHVQGCDYFVGNGYTVIIPCDRRRRIQIIHEIEGDVIYFLIGNDDFLETIDIHFHGKRHMDMADRILSDIKRRQIWLKNRKR